MEKLKTVYILLRDIFTNETKIHKFKYKSVDVGIRSASFILSTGGKITSANNWHFYTEKDALKELKKRYIKLYKQKEKELKAIDKKLLKVSKEISK